MRTTQAGNWRGLGFGLGTHYPVVAIEGADDLPAVRTYDVDRPQTDGAWTGADLLSPRKISMTLGIRGTTGPDLESRRLSARLQLGVSRVPELLTLPNGSVVYAKLRRAGMPSDMTADWRLGEIILEFYCADPRLYAAAEQSVSLVAGAIRTDGRHYPRHYPAWAYPAFLPSISDGNLTNGGNTDAPTEWVITGPLSAPITCEVVGHSILTINANLTAGDTLTVTRDQNLLLNGITRRDLIAVGAVWPWVPPGMWTVRLTARIGGGSAVVTMRSATL